MKTITIMMMSAALLGCASLTYKKDAEKVSKLKRIAIVALSIEQPKNSEEKILGALMGDDNDIHPALCSEGKHVTPAAQVLAKVFSEKTKLEVVPFQRFLMESDYKQVYESNDAAAVTMLMSKRNICYHAAPLLDYFKWPRLSALQIRQIKNALKVDAVMRVHVMAEQNATTVMGVALGGAKTQVRIAAELYDGSTDAPIYYDTNAKGEEVKDGTTSILGFSDRNAVNEKTVIGVESAAQKLAERFLK